MRWRGSRSEAARRLERRGKVTRSAERTHAERGEGGRERRSAECGADRVRARRWAAGGQRAGRRGAECGRLRARHVAVEGAERAANKVIATVARAGKCVALTLRGQGVEVRGVQSSNARRGARSWKRARGRAGWGRGAGARAAGRREARTRDKKTTNTIVRKRSLYLRASTPFAAFARVPFSSNIDLTVPTFYPRLFTLDPAPRPCT